MIGGIVVLAALIAAGALFVVLRQSDESDLAGGGPVTFKDPQFGYVLVRPAAWRQTSGAKESTVHFAVRDGKGKTLGGVDVYADKSLEHGIAGLTMGFENYLPVLMKRYEGFSLIGSKAMKIHDVKVIFFAFESREKQGKGVYTQDGDLQISVECASPKQTYLGAAKSYTEILQSFALVQRQKFMDFPKPDEIQRKIAITDPARLTADAQQEDKVGQDLIRLKDVRPENLFNAIQHFKSALQKLSALGTKPPFFADIAQRLRQANTLFDSTVRDQWFKITAAAKNQDMTTASLEATRLMMMVPDKRDPTYQDALAATKEYVPPEQ
jgi:hypothetical protein